MSVTPCPVPHAAVHFLHIGKTGGTAVKYVLAKALAQHPWLTLHDHPTTLADIPEGERVFFFLRDPISRFVSGFYSRQRQGRPRYHFPWSAAEAVAFAEFKSPNELASALSAEDDSARTRAETAMKNIQHVRDSYWRWLGTSEQLARRSGDVLFIGRQEHLADDMKVLARHLSLELQDLPADDVEAHRNPPNLDRRLDEKALANLRQWYEADYQALKACAQVARDRRFGGSLEDFAQQSIAGEPGR